MRTRLSIVTLTAATAVLLLAPPALAQSTGPGARPWHYWIAPLLLGGAVLVVAAVGVGYYIRVMGGRRR